MEAHLQFLLCGYNGSGYSALISMEKKLKEEEIKVYNRIIINTGDGTQRICNENKIKLFHVSTIIINSLCPQNISGFPGVFLALSDLGVGEVTVYGPPGLNLVLNLMLPFINRKHPVLKIIEIVEVRSERVKGGILHLIPLSAVESKAVLAISCSFTPMDDSSFHFNEGQSTKRICFLPISIYFPTFPSLEESFSTLLQSEEATPGSCFVFIPLTADSQPIPQDSTLSSSISKEFDRWSRSNNQLTVQLNNLCKVSGSTGFLLTSSVHHDICEFKFAQWNIYKLNQLAQPFFPFTLEANNELDSDQLCDAYLGKCLDSSLLYSLPQMKVILSKELFELKKHQLILSGSVNDNANQSFEGDTNQAQDYKLILSLENSFKKFNLSDFDEKLSVIRDSEGIIVDDSDKLDSYEVQTITPSHDASSNYDAAAKLKAHLLLKRKLIETLPPFSPQLQYQRDDTVSDESIQVVKRERSDSYLTVSTEPIETPSAISSGPSTFESMASSRTNLSSCMSFSTGNGGIAVHASEMFGMESPLKVMRITPRYETVWSPKARGSGNVAFFTKDLVETEENQRDSPEMFEKGVEIGIPREDEEEEEDDNEPIETEKLISPFIHPNKLQRMQTLLQRIETQIPPPNPFQDLFLLTFLGTGCATPSKHRNASSIMIKLHAEPSSSFSTTNASDKPRIDPILLLDVGEGATAQLFQSVSGDLERFDEILLNIRVIWISHHHADHATGLPLLIHYIRKARVRKERKEKQEAEKNNNNNKSTDTSSTLSDNPSIIAPQPITDKGKKKFARKGLSLSINTTSTALNTIYEENKILLIASDKILKYYEEFLKLSNLHSIVTFCNITNTLYAGMTSDIMKATNGIVKKFQSIPVIHCQNSFGCVIEFTRYNYEGIVAQPYRMVYSGDCRPSQSLIRAGQGCDVLIHEATFTFEKAEDAIKKKHSTLDEAIHTAIKMNAKHLILTHFSQRYPIYHTSNSRTTSQPSLIPLPPPPPPLLDRSRSLKSESPFVNMFSPGNHSQHSRSDTSSLSQRRSKSESITTFTSSDLVSMQSYQPVSFAYDLLKVSFPSQIEILPEITKSISELLYEIEKI